MSINLKEKEYSFAYTGDIIRTVSGKDSIYAVLNKLRLLYDSYVDFYVKPIDEELYAVYLIGKVKKIDSLSSNAKIELIGHISYM